MTLWFGLPHAPGLVALSVVVAVFGGYVGLGLAGQAKTAGGFRRRGLLAGAAWSLGLAIWTMHFIGMLAAQLPDGTTFSVLLTLLSFLLCVLVVGFAAFLVSQGTAKRSVVALASLIMGAGIVGMHYIGMHAITGNFMLQHDPRYVLLAALIAAASSYGALRMFESLIRHQTLAVSALIFGLAVSGMHYTAMMGTRIMPSEQQLPVFGPSVSSDVLMIVVALLAFLVSGVFLLYLIPEIGGSAENARSELAAEAGHKSSQHPTSLVPIESEGAIRLIPASDVFAIQATTHYTLVYDGLHEHFSPWSISEAETRLDRDLFVRVHRSHLVAIGKVRALRRAGGSAVVEIGGATVRIIPVSRSHYAELKSRLGLQHKIRPHTASQEPA